MRSTLLLTRLELRSAFGLNRALHTRDPKAKNRYRLLAAAFAVVIAMALFYVGGLVYGLCLLGLSDLAPAYLVILGSALVLLVGFLQAGPAVFSKRGYDLLCAMPVTPGAVAASRMLALYAQNWVLGLGIMLPGLAVYGVMARPGILFYLTAVFCSLWIPAIPLVISLLAGTAVMALSSGMRHKSLAQAALMVGLVLAILAGSFRLGSFSENLTPEVLANLAASLSCQLGRLYPPAAWAGSAMLGRGFAGLLLFAGISLAGIGLSSWLISRHYSGIMEKLQSFATRRSYKLDTLHSRDLTKALYLRELRRYFSSSIYVTNTIIGPILGCILAGVLCFPGLETIRQAIPLDIQPVLPFAFAAVFTMMTTTATAISMEGRQFWVAKSLPIPTKALLDSKLLLNLSLMAPWYLLGEVFLTIALRPRPLALLWQILIPGEIIVLAVVWGITANLLLPNLSWDKEEQVVKQSASAALGGFGGFLLSAILGAGALAVPDAWQALYFGVLCLALPVVTLLLYRGNNRADLAQL